MRGPDEGLLAFTGVNQGMEQNGKHLTPDLSSAPAGPPPGMREIPVLEHTADVKVGSRQRLVERLDLIMDDGDVRQLDIPGEPGEAFDDVRFAQRRREALERLAGEGPLPGVLGRQYVIWEPGAEEE